MAEGRVNPSFVTAVRFQMQQKCAVKRFQNNRRRLTSGADTAGQVWPVVIN